MTVDVGGPLYLGHKGRAHPSPFAAFTLLRFKKRHQLTAGLTVFQSLTGQLGIQTCNPHYGQALMKLLLITLVLAYVFSTFLPTRGWSGGAIVLGKLPVPGRPTILITVGQGPIALAVGAGGGGLDIFTLIYPFSSFSLSLGDGSI